MHWPLTSSSATSTEVASKFSANELPSPDVEMVSRPVTLTSVTNASVYLTGGRHAVRTNDGSLISVHRVQSTRLAEIPWRTHHHLPGTSLILGNSAGANCYYHWMLDLLPKLGYLERAGIDLNSIDYFLVREAGATFQIESLKKFGIDRSRIIETAKNPYLNCDVALMVQLDHQVNLTMHRFVPYWLNNMFGKPDSSNSYAKPGKKLYIKRPQGVRRGIENSDTVEKLLRSRSFEITAMEGLSIEQQAELLAQADVVVSPHGGALTNLVFAQPGTKVIELFGTHVYPFYFGLANLCQLEYHAVLQSREDYASLVQLETALAKGTSENQLISQREGFSVDLTALDSAISAVCS